MREIQGFNPIGGHVIFRRLDMLYCYNKNYLFDYLTARKSKGSIRVCLGLLWC